MPHPPPIPALPVSADHASHRSERPSEVIMARRQPSRTSLGECGRQDSNLQRPAFQAGALPVWSYDHASGRGWTRTSDLLFVRQALGLSELLARVRRWAELGSNQPPPPYQRGARPTELPALDVSPPMAASPASATQDPKLIPRYPIEVIMARRSRAGLRSAFRDKDSNLDLHVQSVTSFR
jgi:hypothetical protein